MFAPQIPASVKAVLAWGDHFTRPGERKALRVGAVVVSLSLHLGLLLLFILPGVEGAALNLGAGAGKGEERAYTVSLSGLTGDQWPLARMPSSPTTPKPQPKPDPMKVLFGKLTDDPSAIPVPKPSTKANTSQLLDDIDPSQNPNSKPAKKADAVQGDRGKGATRGAAQGADTEAKVVKNLGRGNGAPSRGSLAGQIESCWTRLSGRSAVPVTLVVIVGARGQITVPPEIVRPAHAALDETRLLSEERAIRALAGCVPYRGRRQGRRPECSGSSLERTVRGTASVFLRQRITWRRILRIHH